MAMAVIISPRDGNDMASSSDDFDFSISHDISVEDSSPAGEIFSDGKLLPLSSIPVIATSTNIIPLQQHRQTDLEHIDDRKVETNNNLEEDISSIKKSSAVAASSRSSSSSFWSRSRSVGTSSSVSRSVLSSICSFPRSKSTGSYLNQDQDQNQNQNHNDKKRLGKRNQKLRRGPNNNCYYYSGSCKRSGHGNGVRINPVINVHAHFVPRGGSGRSKNCSSGTSGNGLFAYLLCNCGDKSTKELEAS